MRPTSVTLSLRKVMPTSTEPGGYEYVVVATYDKGSKVRRTQVWAQQDVAYYEAELIQRELSKEDWEK